VVRRTTTASGKDELYKAIWCELLGLK
jgi:hypothetical protein